MKHEQWEKFQKIREKAMEEQRLLATSTPSSEEKPGSGPSTEHLAFAESMECLYVVSSNYMDLSTAEKVLLLGTYRLVLEILEQYG